MIFNSAYDTWACKGYNIGPIIAGVLRAQQGGYTPTIHPNILTIQDGEYTTDSIPSFTHALPVVESERRKGATPDVRVAVDVRPYGKWDRAQMTFRVTVPGEYELATLRGRLTYIWLADMVQGLKPTHFRDLSPLCMRVYADWLAIEMQRKFGLDPGQQYKMTMLAAVYYYTLFSNDEKWDEQDNIRCSGYVSRALHVSQADVLEVCEQLEEPMKGIDTFCVAAAKVTGSLRLQELTPAVLYALVGGSWFGAQGRELAHVALEHPPTWIAMIYRAIEERGYQGTGVGKLVNRTARNGETKALASALVTLVNDRAPYTSPVTF